MQAIEAQTQHRDYFLRMLATVKAMPENPLKPVIIAIIERWIDLA